MRKGKKPSERWFFEETTSLILEWSINRTYSSVKAGNYNLGVVENEAEQLLMNLAICTCEHIASKSDWSESDKVNFENASCVISNFANDSHSQVLVEIFNSIDFSLHSKIKCGLLRTLARIPTSAILVMKDALYQDWPNKIEIESLVDAIVEVGEDHQTIEMLVAEIASGRFKFTVKQMERSVFAVLSERKLL